MDFSLSAEQEAIRAAVEKICARFGDDYWLAKDRDGGFPDDFHRAFADAGWLGVCIPQEYGGAGLGVTEAALMMQTIAESGAGLSGASALHMNIFGLPNLTARTSTAMDDIATLIRKVQLDCE